MITELVESVLRAAAWQLITYPPLDRCFNLFLINAAHHVATGEWIMTPAGGGVITMR